MNFWKTSIIVFILFSFFTNSYAEGELIVVEDYRDDVAAMKLIERLDNYSDKKVKLAPMRTENKFITSDEFHSYFRSFLNRMKNKPDIFYIDQVYLADFVQSGYLAPFNSTNAHRLSSKYLDFATEGAYYNGKLWALPIHAEVGVIYYRKDLLSEFGLKEPETWDDIKNDVRIIKGKYPSIQGYVGQFKAYEGLVCNFLEFAWSNGADPFNIDANNRQKLIEVLQTLVDWIQKYDVIPKEALDMTEGESMDVFTDRRAIFLRHWPSGGLTWFKKRGLGDSVGMMALPKGPSGKEAYMVTGGWYFVVNANSEHIKESMLALEYLDNENSQMINFETKREMPTLKSLFNSNVVREGFPDYYEYISERKFKPRNRPQTPFYSEYSKIISSSVHKALEGKLSPEDAVSRMERELDNLRSVIAGYKNK